MALTTEKFKELMEMMIEKQNKDIEEKLGDKLEDVKKEMSGAIKIVADRQDKMETEQMDMKDQMGLLRAQMEDIKKIAEVSVQQQAEQHQQHQEQHQQQPDQQQSSVSYSDALQSSPKPKLHSPDFLPSDESERRKALDLLDLGRRTVSFIPSNSQILTLRQTEVQRIQMKQSCGLYRLTCVMRWT